MTTAQVYETSVTVNRPVQGYTHPTPEQLYQYSDSGKKKEVAWKWGLIALATNFKLTNMADDQVDLTPEVIPGVNFIEEEIEKLTVSQLKFWLKCLL